MRIFVLWWEDLKTVRNIRIQVIKWEKRNSGVVKVSMWNGVGEEDMEHSAWMET